ncbi:MAG: LON peptidase substrate-binding domain-containing protein, partial [Verrucomicrobia bacterium]|nr:LON peptidase substrate-binding domain-containing protein [Verrucomicrobiota bacterium]
MSHGENNGRGPPGMPVAVEAGPAELPGRHGTVPDDHTQRVLPVLPLNDVVLFPSMVAPLVVNTQRSMKLAEDIAAGDRLFIAVLQREGDVPDDKVVPSQLHTIGCIARMIRMLRFPDESLRILVQGQHRCRLTGFEKGKVPYLRAGFTTLKDDTGNGIEMEALARNASQRFQEVITLSPSLPEELKVALFNIDDPAKLSDLIAANLPMPMGDRQGLLDLTSVRARLERITVLLNRERE